MNDCSPFLEMQDFSFPHKAKTNPGTDTASYPTDKMGFFFLE